MSNDACGADPAEPRIRFGRFQLMKDSPICALKWAQPKCGSRDNEAYLELGLENEGGGAFFYLRSTERFYFDSGDDLRHLADIVDAILKPFSDSDVFCS
jgi:hypothetical protein